MIKTNCDSCVMGKHDDCIDENCLCREGHAKQDLIKEFTEKTKELLPNHDELKELIKNNPEKYTIEKKHREYADDLMKSHIFKTLDDTREILYYQKGVYNPGGEVLIAGKCQRMVFECSKHNVNEITDIIRRRTFCKRDEFNKDFSKIVLNNGIFDLEKMELSKHTSDHLSTIKMPIDYDPKARCPMFIKFLKDCLEPKDFVTVLESMANILTGNRFNFEVCMMWVGEGSNGKTRMLNIIVGIIGSANCSHVSIHSMNSDKFAISQLDGKLANTYADISNRELNSLGVFKQLVSGDPIPAQKKGKTHFTLNNYAKMFSSANEMPNVLDNSDGAFRRIYVIKWKNQFIPGINRIENFGKMILDNEKSGIFNMMVENYKTLMQNQGFRYKQNIAQVREMIKRESDKLQEFIDTCLVKMNNYDITKDIFYEVIQKWFMDRGYEVFTKQKIGANLSSYGIMDEVKKINGKATRVWLNIAFNMKEEFIKNNVIEKGLGHY